VFKKSRIPISYWYLATVVVMAICYLVLSRMDFAGMVVVTLGYLMIGILICIVPVLLIGSGVVTFYFLRRRLRNRQNQNQP
jgi:uncharacterized membrane protein YidH (DUF202 family)